MIPAPIMKIGISFLSSAALHLAEKLAESTETQIDDEIVEFLKNPLRIILENCDESKTK